MIPSMGKNIRQMERVAMNIGTKRAAPLVAAASTGDFPFDIRSM